MINDSSSSHCFIPESVSVNKVHKKIDQQTAQTGYQSTFVTGFFKWAVNKPQSFIAVALWLSALGTGAVSVTLPRALASRSVRSSGRETAIPFAKASTADYSWLTIGAEGTFPDMTISSDESRFAISGDTTTTPWLEAAFSELLSDSEKLAEGDRFANGFNGEIRLISECKSHKHGFKDGRVELSVNGTWGTICNDYFDNTDAAVVCRMMALPDEDAMELPEGACSSGTGPIILTDLACNGDEASLVDCEHGKLRQIDCDHREDVAVRCSKPVRFSPESKISSDYSGRIQIWNNINKTWSYVKRDDFTSMEAGVFCQEMGFGKTDAHITTFSQDGREDCGSDCTMIQGVHCSGNETRLLDCIGEGSLIAEACDAPCEVVSVRCRHWLRLHLIERSYMNHNDIPGSVTGRVEAFYNNTWQALGRAGFDRAAAQVVCRDLGYPLDDSVASLGAARDDLPILINKVHCSGNENNFSECEYELSQQATQSLGNTVAAVRCQSKTRVAPDCKQDVGSTVSGRIEAWYDGSWRGVCLEHLDNTFITAAVVCREQGYPPDGAALIELHDNSCHGGRYSRVLANVTCSGSEESLIGCNLKAVDSPPAPCKPVAVRCTKQIRLFENNCRNIPGYVSGDLEIWVKGTWQPFRWTTGVEGIQVAQVACNELGYQSKYAGAFSSCQTRSNYTGDATVSLCENGYEKRVRDCRSYTRKYKSIWYSSNCLSIKCAEKSVPILSSATMVPTAVTSITVRTVPTATKTIRLSSDCKMPETGPVRGRVELFHQDQWGTVCGDSFSLVDAEVVCQALGFAKNGSMVLPPGTCPAGTGPILLDNVHSSGNETGLWYFDHDRIWVNGCTHDRDAAVLCSNQIRLASDCKTRKPSYAEGRVELLVNGTWGTVCNKYFSTVNANVVCRLLGLPPDGAMEISENACFGGSGSIYLDHVTCRGNETSLLECSNNGLGVHDCSHSEDVAVRCKKPVRFAPDCHTSSRSGRIQLWYQGAWANVHDQSFDSFKAEKFCQEFGLPGADSYVLTSNPDDCPVTDSSTNRVLKGLHCSGSERSLLDCINKEPVQSCEPPCAFISVSCSPGVRLERAKRSYVAEEDLPGTVFGKVEIFLNSQWTTIKSGGVDDVAAGVVCRELGYPSQGSIAISAPSKTWGSKKEVGEIWKWNYYYPATDSILLKNIHCNGTETRLSDCDYVLNHPYENSTDWAFAAIRCQSRVRFAPECPTIDSGDTVTGRFEIWYKDAWHAVGNEHITDHAARVACNEMGYPEGSITLTQSAGSSANRTIEIINVNCSGQASELMDCNLQPADRALPVNNTCGPVSLQCNKQIRLQRFGCQPARNGTVTGQPEVLVKGKWQGICRDGLGSKEAGVLCAELGYAREGAKVLPFRTCPLGTLTRDIANFRIRRYKTELIVRVDCQGHEEHLKDCNIYPIDYPYDFYFRYDYSNCNTKNQVSINCLEATPAPCATPATAANPVALCSNTLDKRGNNTSGQDDNVRKILIGCYSAIGLAGTAFATCLMLNARKLKLSNKDIPICQSLRKALPLTIKNLFYFLKKGRIADLQAVPKQQNCESSAVPMGGAMGPMIEQQVDSIKHLRF